MQIAIMGVAGRMGSAIADVIQEKHPEFLLGGSVSGEAGKTRGLFNKADVVIDFTSPKALELHCQLAKESKTSLIIGTTGLDGKHLDMLRETAKTVAVVYAPNMSLGVNILLSLVEKTAEILNEDFDIEILEAHHKHKKDAPSGTAIALGKAAAIGRKIENYQPDYNNREGERKSGAIGYSVIRGGDIVGEHNVIFASAGERIELAHKATDRKIFARGALHAALWVKDKQPKLYSMQDVLGL